MPHVPIARTPYRLSAVWNPCDLQTAIRMFSQHAGRKRSLPSPSPQKEKECSLWKRKKRKRKRKNVVCYKTGKFQQVFYSFPFDLSLMWSQPMCQPEFSVHLIIGPYLSPCLFLSPWIKPGLKCFWVKQGFRDLPLSNNKMVIKTKTRLFKHSVLRRMHLPGCISFSLNFPNKMSQNSDGALWCFYVFFFNVWLRNFMYFWLLCINFVVSCLECSFRLPMANVWEIAIEAAGKTASIDQIEIMKF